MGIIVPVIEPGKYVSLRKTCYINLVRNYPELTKYRHRKGDLSGKGQSSFRTLAVTVWVICG